MTEVAAGAASASRPATQPATQPASQPSTASPAAAGAAATAPAASRPAAGSSRVSRERDRRPRFYVVPNVAYDSDDGLGFGVRGELAFRAPGYRPYRTAYVAHLFASLRGFHHHRLRFDRVGIGAERRLRLTVHLAWRQWLNDGYWGIGNRTTRERLFVGDFDDNDPARKRYRYTLRQPFLHTTLRYLLGGPFHLFTSVNAKWSLIETYPESLLEEQQPFGMDGGLGVILSAGVLLDTRHPEVNSERGVLVELSGRWAVPGGAGSFGGPLASVRGFVTPWSRLTLAGRVMAEYLHGHLPFYEMVHWGGSVPVTGFGGFETLRGVSFGRWRAPGKVIVNGEARLRVLEHTARRRPLVWQLALLTDAGVVFGAESTTPTGGPPVHPAFGLGLRAVYDEIFVGRIDTGVGLDPVREPDGSITIEPSIGVYVVFDHAF